MKADKCAWCQTLELVERYHDEEWGIPVHDDRRQFEFLMMEVMQCGLNWTMMLKKREIFRQCFDNFDYEKIALYNGQKIQEILQTPGMIRSARKIGAVIGNAAAFLKIIEEYGSFDSYLWGCTGFKTLVHLNRPPVASDGLSDRISRDLKKRGFRYLGSITVYAHLQACGIVNDHENGCFLYKKITENYPVQYIEQGL